MFSDFLFPPFSPPLLAQIDYGKVLPRLLAEIYPMGEGRRCRRHGGGEWRGSFSIFRNGQFDIQISSSSSFFLLLLLINEAPLFHGASPHHIGPLQGSHHCDSDLLVRSSPSSTFLFFFFFLIDSGMIAVVASPFVAPKTGAR